MQEVFSHYYAFYFILDLAAGDREIKLRLVMQHMNANGVLLFLSLLYNKQVIQFNSIHCLISYNYK